MAPQTTAKRKNPPQATTKASHRPAKRVKMNEARRILTQTSDKALNQNGDLNVASFVKAREFEIKAMAASMTSSKNALSARAFQQVPKDMRRRTASHNVKRVPKRLRARAAREVHNSYASNGHEIPGRSKQKADSIPHPQKMKDDNTPTVTSRRRTPTPHQRLRLEKAKKLKALGALTKKNRLDVKPKDTQKPGETDPEKMVAIVPRLPKLKKNTLAQPANPPARFRKRQIHKSWLPTHVWHAKRARMTEPMDPLWRFAVPLTPTEKCFRTTHRAASGRGCVAWDMSYMSTIGVEGVEGSLVGLLKGLGVDEGQLTGRAGAKWMKGTRSWEGWLRERDGERSWIAPVTVVWCVSEEIYQGGDDIEAKKKIKRKLLIRVHPSAFLQVWNEVLKVAKMQRPAAMVEDLRFEIGSIEITGPGAAEALTGVLHPVSELEAKAKDLNSNDAAQSSSAAATTTDVTGSIPREEEDWTDIPNPSQVFQHLSSVTNPSSLPSNALLAFNIDDPRLTHPPRTIETRPSDNDILLDLLSTWPPDQTTTPCSIFDRTARLTACRLLSSQKAINRRKAAASPGAFPSPLPTDPSIPIMILASRSPCSPSSSLYQTSPVWGEGSWTLLLPWSYVLPVWYSLMHYPLSTGGTPRFGGLLERQQISFEQRIPWFPGDFPGTMAGWTWEMREQERARKEWERRPKGKRCEWESIDLGMGRKGEIGVGWGCDWERLLSGPPVATEDVTKSAKELAMVAAKSKEGGEATASEGPATDTSARAVAQHQVQLDAGPEPIEKPRPALPMLIKYIPLPSLQNHNIAPTSSTAASLIPVSLAMLAAGHPSRNARIYRLPSTSSKLRARRLAYTYSQIEAIKTGQTEIGKAQSKGDNRRQNPLSKNAPPHEKAQRLAASLISPPPVMSTNLNGDVLKANDKDYPPVPGEEDLIGFVTSANFHLGQGKCAAIGNIFPARVLGDSQPKNGGQGQNVPSGGKISQNGSGVHGKNWRPDSRLCIVRNAGQSVGRLARWTFV